MSKTQELLIDQEIKEMLDKEAIKKVEYHIPDQFLSNILLIKKEGLGKSSMYKLKSSQQLYSMQAFQNGRFALLEIPSRGKQFSLQGRSERCLFLSAAVHLLTCFDRLFNILFKSLSGMNRSGDCICCYCNTFAVDELAELLGQWRKSDLSVLLIPN